MTEMQQDANISLNVITQYIRDISFENPNAPASLVTGETQPSIDINVDVEVQELQKENYEIRLKIMAHADREEKVMFHLELDYAGLFVVQCEDSDLKQQLLLIHCPNLLFPFARHIIANLTREAGFPPLLLNPIDFASLYHRKQEEKQLEKQ